MNISQTDRLNGEKHLRIVLPSDMEHEAAAMPWEKLHSTRKELRQKAEVLNGRESKGAEEERSIDVALEYLAILDSEFDKRAISENHDPRPDDIPYKPSFRKSPGGENIMHRNVLDYLVRGEELPPEMRSLAAETGTAGGFFLSEPAQAMGLTFVNEGLLGKCRRMQTPQNATTIQLASFMESDWTTSGPYGVGINITSENATITETDLSAHCIKFEVQMFAGLVSASRLFFDSNEGAAANVAEAFNRNLAWKMDSQIIGGSGVSQFVGLKNAPCAISVNRTTAGDIVLGDIFNMIKMKMPHSSPGQNYTWIASPGAFSRILDLEDSGGTNLFIPPAANSPEYRLLGYPIYISDSSSALGTKADLILADMNLYQIVQFGAPRIDVSREAYFTSDKVAVKLVFFADARSLMRSAITTNAGTFSHIVVLE